MGERLFAHISPTVSLSARIVYGETMRKKGTGTVEALPSGKFRGRLPGRAGAKLPASDTREGAEAALDIARARVARGLSPFDVASPAAVLAETVEDLFRGVDDASYVYFVQEIGSGFVKIGRTNNPDVRVHHIQTHSAGKVDLLCVVPGGSRLEHTFHVAFACLRRRGEWFDPSPAMLALVAELTALWVVP